MRVAACGDNSTPRPRFEFVRAMLPRMGWMFKGSTTTTTTTATTTYTTTTTIIIDIILLLLLLLLLLLSILRFQGN